MVRRGAYKYIRFGTAFAAFAGYAPLLFDVEADPDELTDLAAALPATAAGLDALLTLEVGDPDAIDRAAKAHDQDLFRALAYAKEHANDTSSVFAHANVARLGMVGHSM